MENVSALVGKKFVKMFNEWQRTLEALGYKNFAKVMNAKDYGVAQNRERIFLVSIRDDAAQYEWPKPIRLQKLLRDYLEKNVPERYFLSDKAIKGFIAHKERNEKAGNGFGWNPTIGDVVANSITVHNNDRPADNYIFEPIVLGWTRDQKGNIVDRHPVQVANAITANRRDNTMNYVLEPKINRVGELTDKKWQSKVTRQQDMVISPDGISPDITALHVNHAFKILDDEFYRVRRLTERECFRLMDVPEEAIDKMQAAGISRTQQHRLAGNSIVVSNLYYILYRLFIDTAVTEPTLF